MLKVLLLVAVLAVVVYSIVRLLQSGPRRPRGRTPAPRPLAPDDDPDFLRDLDRKRRQSDDSDS